MNLKYPGFHITDTTSEYLCDTSAAVFTDILFNIDHVLGVDLCSCLICITNPYSVEHFKKTGRQVFKIESTHLSVLLQQHLLQDWLDPIVKCDIVFIGHQKVPNPAVCKWHTEKLTYQWKPTCVFSAYWDWNAQLMSHSKIMHHCNLWISHLLLKINVMYPVLRLIIFSIKSNYWEPAFF